MGRPRMKFPKKVREKIYKELRRKHGCPILKLNPRRDHKEAMLLESNLSNI